MGDRLGGVAAQRPDCAGEIAIGVYGRVAGGDPGQEVVVLEQDLKREVLGAIVSGTPTAVAMSEPGSGSDVASLRCKAEKVDGVKTVTALTF